MTEDAFCKICGAYWQCDCTPAGQSPQSGRLIYTNLEGTFVEDMGPAPMKPLPSWLSDALQPGSHEQGVTYTAGDYESMKQYMTNTEAARFVWGGDK